MDATEVADRVHRLAHAHVNCYLVEDDDGVTLVDAGLPSMWDLMTETLRRLGRGPADVRALVLTHGHFDHVGFARRARVELEVPVLVHPADGHLAAHPYSYIPQRNRFLYPFTHPRSLPVLGRMAMAGALTIKGVEDTEELPVGPALDVPGRPVAMFAPGHTGGHCILHLPDRDTVLSGDALVTLDPYTGATDRRSSPRRPRPTPPARWSLSAQSPPPGPRPSCPATGTPGPTESTPRSDTPAPSANTDQSASLHESRETRGEECLAEVRGELTGRAAAASADPERARRPPRRWR